MPESALITAMISAMQAFIREVSGTQAKKLSTGHGFVFHIEKVGRISIVVATDEDDRPTEQLTNLRTRFLHKFGGKVDTFRGVTDDFDAFIEDVREIFEIKGTEKRVEPSKQLNSFALIQIKPELQKAARAMVMKKEAGILELKEELETTPFRTRELLEELLELGYIGRYFDGEKIVYYL
jgi:hypothetical protein